MKLPAKLLVFILHLTFITASFGQVSTRDTIHKMVTEMVATNRYDENFSIGIGGILSKQYQLFQRLVQIATPQQLIELTSHKNAVVRLYAFQALRSKEVIIPERTLKQFANDTSIITVMRGCIVLQQSMNLLIEHKLTSYPELSN